MPSARIIHHGRDPFNSQAILRSVGALGVSGTHGDPKAVPPGLASCLEDQELSIDLDPIGSSFCGFWLDLRYRTPKRNYKWEFRYLYLGL